MIQLEVASSVNCLLNYQISAENPFLAGFLKHLRAAVNCTSPSSLTFLKTYKHKPQIEEWWVRFYS